MKLDSNGKLLQAIEKLEANIKKSKIKFSLNYDSNCSYVQFFFSDYTAELFDLDKTTRQHFFIEDTINQHPALNFQLIDQTPYFYQLFLSKSGVENIAILDLDNDYFFSIILIGKPKKAEKIVQNIIRQRVLSPYLFHSNQLKQIASDIKSILQFKYFYQSLLDTTKVSFEYSGKNVKDNYKEFEDKFAASANLTQLTFQLPKTTASSCLLLYSGSANIKTSSYRSFIKYYSLVKQSVNDYIFNFINFYLYFWQDNLKQGTRELSGNVYELEFTTQIRVDPEKLLQHIKQAQRALFCFVFYTQKVEGFYKQNLNDIINGYPLDIEFNAKYFRFFIFDIKNIPLIFRFIEFLNLHFSTTYSDIHND